MVAVPLAFATAQTASTGAQLASRVATTQVQPKGSFFGELGGLFENIGQTAVSTIADIVRLRAEAERQKALDRFQPRLVPGQVPTAEQQGQAYLPTQFRPIMSNGVGGGMVPMLILGGAGLLLLAVLVKRT